MKFFKKTSLVLAILLPSFLSAEVIVHVVNATRSGMPQRVEKISLLRLQSGMTPEREISNPPATVRFNKLQEGADFPYMIQAVYRGIVYSRILPPGRQKGEVTLEVYDRTSNFAANMSVAMIYKLRYVGSRLEVFQMIQFRNPSQKTFSEPGEPAGVLALVPENARNLSASASVGSGKSDIQWLKLQPTRKAHGRVLLPQAIKPGLKIFQLNYDVPYEGKRITFLSGSAYPLSKGLQLIVQPEDIFKSVQEIPAYTPKAEYEESLEEKIFSLPAKKTTVFHLVLEGGEPFPETKPQPEQKLEVHSPISNQMKILLSFVLAIVLGAGSLWLARSRFAGAASGWSKKRLVAKLVKAEAELNIMKDSGYASKHPELYEKLRRKVEHLKEQLDS